MRAIALHNRDQFLSMLRRALARAVHAQKDSLAPRTHKTLEQMLYAIILTGTTRLNRLAQLLLPLRQARRALYVEKTLSTALHNARYNETALFHAYSRVVYQALPTPAFVTYRGRRILVIAPTTYEKRTRQGKRGRSMQYPTPLKDLPSERYPKGYVDV